MGKVVGERGQKRRRIRQEQDENVIWNEMREEQQQEQQQQQQPDSEQWMPFLSPCQDESWSHIISGDYSSNDAFPDFASELSGLDFTDETGPTHPLDVSSTAAKLPDVNLLTPAPSECSLGLGLELYRPSQPPSWASSSTSPAESSSLSSAVGEALDMASWVKHISDLNEKLSQSPLPLDEVLSANAHLLQSIPSALQWLPSDGSHLSTVLIILICLTQILTLFEQCIHSSSAKAPSQDKAGLTLQLGAFKVDMESQHGLQMHIVCKELMRVLEVGKSVRAALQRPQGGLGSQSRTYVALIEDVQRRVRVLVYFVKHSWG